MKLFILLLIFPLVGFAEKLPTTASLRSGEILFECSKITDKKIIRAVYLAQQEFLLKARYRNPRYSFDYNEARSVLGLYFEPEKYPKDILNPRPLDLEFKANGTYLHLHPNSQSPVVGVVTTQIMNGNFDKCGEYLPNAWGANNLNLFFGVIASSSGKYLGSVFDDYMAFVGDFWRLPPGMPEEYSMQACKDTIKHHRCYSYPEFDMPGLTIRGIVYRNDEVWYQMPFMVDGVYPWVKNKLLKKNRQNPKIEDGKVFGDLANKKVKFLVYPEYFESVDGKIVYLVNPELKDKFKERLVKILTEGVTPWWNFRVSRTDSDYIYFNVMYEVSFEGKKLAEITKDLPPLELRVPWELVTRPNGSLRIYEYEVRKFNSGHLNEIKRQRPYFFKPGDTYLIPKDVSAIDVFKNEIGKIKDNHRRESVERFLKDFVWN